MPVYTQSMYSLYTLECDDLQTIPKDALVRYSRLKHGSVESTKYFAKMLAEHLLKSGVPANSLLMPPPTTGMPSAADHLCYEVYCLLMKSGIPIDYTRVLLEDDNDSSVSHDYSKLDAVSRVRAQSDRYRGVANHIPDAIEHLIVVNDCTISGAQQRSLKSELDKIETLVSIKWLYVVSASSASPVSPEVEFELNRFSVQSRADMLEMMKREPVRTTARAARTFGIVASKIGTSES